MKSHNPLLLNQHDIHYAKMKDALLSADEAIKRNDIFRARQIIEFVFNDSRNVCLNSSQELVIVVILLQEFYITENLNRLPLFFNIFDICSKNHRKFVLLKFIITAIAIHSKPALNASGTYLLELAKDIQMAGDFGQMLVNEISLYNQSSSVEDLKEIPLLSPIFTNAFCLIIAEIYNDNKLPDRSIVDVLTNFMSVEFPALIYSFTIPIHKEIGAFILAGFFRFSVLSELYEKKPFSKLHSKVLAYLSNIENNSTAKPIIYTQCLESIIDKIHRSSKVVSPQKIQNSIEKLAQIIQISKRFFYGNVPMLYDRLKQLPKNRLLDFVISSK